MIGTSPTDTSSKRELKCDTSATTLQRRVDVGRSVVRTLRLRAEVVETAFRVTRAQAAVANHLSKLGIVSRNKSGKLPPPNAELYEYNVHELYPRSAATAGRVE